MTTDVVLDTLAGLPAANGPHELAWSYILDAVFADAYHAGVGRLEVFAPSTEVQEGARTRAVLSTGGTGGAARAVALLGGRSGDLKDVDRVYVLRFGTLAPQALRRVDRPTMEGFEQVDCLSVFTFSAKLWGIPIRLSAVAGRPDLGDRAMAAMRRAFAEPNERLAYYRLSMWNRA